jgi:hypothetical protein
LYARNRFDEVISAVETGLKEHPGNADLTELRSAAIAAREKLRREALVRSTVARVRELAAARDYERAGRALQEILAGDPRDAQLLQLKSEIETERKAWTAEQTEQEVRRVLSEVRTLLPAQPGPAAQLLEPILRKYPGRQDLEAAAAEVREAEAHIRREEEQRRQAAARSAAIAEIGNLLSRRKLAKARSRHAQAVARWGAGAEFDALAAQLETASQPRPRTSRPAVRPRPVLTRALPALAVILAAAYVLSHRSKPVPAIADVPVEIRTDPEGVSVTVGGQSCQTPNCRFNLRPGSYSIHAERAGYETAERPISIAADRPNLVSLSLRPVVAPPPPGRPTGTLAVRTEVPDALVFIDEKPAGRTDALGNFSLPVEAAAHRVRVAKPGYDASAERGVAVAPDKTSRLVFTLTPQLARLELQGAPAGVEVRLNGSLLGTATGSTLAVSLPAGAQTLHISLGTESRDLVRTFEPGQPMALAWSDVGLVAKIVTPPPKIEPPKSDPSEQAWAALRDASDPARVQAFIDRYPNAHAAEAQTLLERLTWMKIGPNDVEGLRGYLARFPAGPHRQQAQSQLYDLAWNAVDRTNLDSLQRFVQQNAGNPHLAEAQPLIDGILNRRAEADKARQRQIQSQGIGFAISKFNDAFKNRRPQDLKQIRSKELPAYLEAMKRTGADYAVMNLRCPALNEAPVADNVPLNCEVTTTLRGKAVPLAARVTFVKGLDGWVISDLSLGR